MVRDNRFRRSWVGVAAAVLGIAASSRAGDVPTDKPVQFNRDIRPILSDNCFACHGPDSARRKASLRLDTHEGLFGDRKDGVPVIPGKPGDSVLYTRIVVDDPDDVMPPPDSHKALTPAQKALFKRWIEEGAAWEPHWSLKRPTRPELPAVNNTSWPRNPIDRFVLARLEAAGLAPAPEADRRTLARRLSFDLTGLPPEPAEVDAFVADTAPDAYERFVDRLMAKPAWGEHRGRYWLDAARYGDTHGIHNDNYREMWAYRDWVINAFNANKPFDRFVVEQLAGDLLPNATLEQQIASGFQRCNITTSEGGSIPEEVQAIYDKDRVETTATVFLGLTMGCAACHDHKFDPISQRDFYSMVAFYRNTTQNPMDGNVPNTPPVVAVPVGADRQRWDALDEQARRADSERQEWKQRTAGYLDNWIGRGLQSYTNYGSTGSLFNITSVGKTNFTADTPAMPGDLEETHGGRVTTDFAKGVSQTVAGPAQEPVMAFAGKTSMVVANVPTATDSPFAVSGWFRVPGKSGSFVAVSGFEDDNGAVDGKQDGDSKPVTSKPADSKPADAKAADSKPADAKAADAKAADAKPADPQATKIVPEPVWTLGFEAQIPTFRLYGGEKTNIGIRTNSSSRPKSGNWVHVAVSYDGSGSPLGVTMYINGKKQSPDRVAGSTELKGPSRSANSIRIGGDGGKRSFDTGEFSQLRVWERELIAEEVDLLSRWTDYLAAVNEKDPSKLTPQQRNDLLTAFLLFDTASFKPYRDASIELQRINFERRQIQARSPTTLVMAEKPDTPTTAHILMRGQYDHAGDEVSAATPASLHAYPDGAPRNRLGLAEWIIDPVNPLTSRVTVNRFWQEIFGTGLVRTSEDFGVMGENPSHPELLDWLAVEFQSPADGGASGDMKRLFKMLVSSATYRQSALSSPDKLQADPQNRLLSRGPRFRMDAEVLRDMALSASGLLSTKVGGPSVKPYQPPGVWEAVAMLSSNTRQYVPDNGESLYRRSLYWFWKRSAPPASMDLFNAPTREVCTVRRERTDTPLQALVAMNDPQWVEAARRLAERTLSEPASSSFDDRLDFITLRVLSRPFTRAERDICQQSLNGFLAAYQADAATAKKLIATGASAANPSLSPTELAAWTMLASQVMNTDEALNK